MLFFGCNSLGHFIAFNVFHKIFQHFSIAAAMYRKIFNELIYLDYPRTLSETRNSNDTNSILLLISSSVQ